MTGVSKITFLRLCYPKLMRKADPNRVCVCAVGEGGGEKHSCEICKSVNGTSHFKRKATNDSFNILKGPLDCNSNLIIYLFEGKQCQYRFPDVGSTKNKFRYRINNYKSTHRQFKKEYVEKDLAIVIKRKWVKTKILSRTLLFRRSPKNWKLECHTHRSGWRSRLS